MKYISFSPLIICLSLDSKDINEGISMSYAIIKNILDLQFQKYLVIASTSIIISFTYIIGIAITFITKQVRMDNPISVIILITFSVLVLGTCTIIFLKALFHIRNIPRILRENSNI